MNIETKGFSPGGGWGGGRGGVVHPSKLLETAGQHAHPKPNILLPIAYHSLNPKH